MKNSERQQQLDKKKWNESEMCGYDKSGLMYYCKGCDACLLGIGCALSQDERQANSTCATAYNRWERNSRSK